ncbi:hypothetical protein [Saccharomonospora sp. NB11]|uniref:hypothetical protein n=1 Tax=Saccharomonospora sp. NB11 TaxID=1642298 RepID=UPI0018D011A1|nr:hypothetical protein [Saccharomonospora sp. NB11]
MTATKRSGQNTTQARFPYGVVVTIIMGITLFFSTYDLARHDDRAVAAVETFTRTPVHVAEGVAVDPEPIRQVIGDRNLVVGVFDEVSSTYELCDEIAQLAPTTAVLAVSLADDETEHLLCTGWEFPAPTLVDRDADSVLSSVRWSAEGAATYLDPDADVTALVTEYVFAFDRELGAAYGDPPRRGPIAAAPDAAELGLGFLAIFGICVSGYLITRDVTWALVHSGVTRPRATGLRERLDRLAPRLMAPGRLTDPEIATTARAYARAYQQLDKVAKGKDRRRLDEVAKQVERLETTLR